MLVVRGAHDDDLGRPSHGYTSDHIHCPHDESRTFLNSSDQSLGNKAERVLEEVRGNLVNNRSTNLEASGNEWTKQIRGDCVAEMTQTWRGHIATPPDEFAKKVLDHTMNLVGDPRYFVDC